MLSIGHFSYGQIKICEADSYHPIDYKTVAFRDSLFRKSVDTVIIYSHWIYTNGWNGYGKVVWKKNGETFLVKFDYDNKMRRELTKLPDDSIVSFFFENRLDTITTNPDKLTIVTTPDGRTFGSMRHDGRHFISIRWSGYEYCFIIDNFTVQHALAHKRSQWIGCFKEEGSSIFFEDGIRFKEESKKAIKRKNKQTQ
jgi:hypothetical protein